MAIAKVRELCEELLGPPQSRGEGAAGAAAEAPAAAAARALAQGWEPETLGLSKRTLLKEVVLPTVAAHSRISAYQRLVSEYKLELEALEGGSPAA